MTLPASSMADAGDGSGVDDAHSSYCWEGGRAEPSDEGTHRAVNGARSFVYLCDRVRPLAL